MFVNGSKLNVQSS